MKVTIADVARLAGVGTTTVSRVINNARNIREETREKVLRAMRELDYYPNLAARSLSRGDTLDASRSRCIGVVLGEDVTQTHTYYSDILETIERELADRQYHVIFSTLSSGPLGNGGKTLQMVHDRIIQAAVIVGQAPRVTLDMFVKEEVPVVLVDAPANVDGIDSIICDNVRGARMMVSHLVGLGHKRIALIRGPREHFFSLDISKGYREGLAEYGLEIDESLIKEGDYHPESGYVAMSSLLQLPKSDWPTAVFANDEMAIGAIRAINERGLKVPGDISVAGFDGIELLMHTQPSLTTIQVPRKSMGRLAVKKLMELFEEGRDGHCFSTSILPVKLIVRESTAVCSQRWEST
ncbi:MAG: LacI family DNA-binding transcriptional regulator [Firmicutes bacterium]|nr:LacI family DNA-binding transcriptional regulator [Bacillota bacterium]